MVNSSNDGKLLQTKRLAQITLTLNSLMFGGKKMSHIFKQTLSTYDLLLSWGIKGLIVHFSNYGGWYPNTFTGPNFWQPIRLLITNTFASSTCILIRQSKGRGYLNRNTFVTFLWLLKGTWSLSQSSIPLKDFLYQALVCEGILRTNGNSRIKVFISQIFLFGAILWRTYPHISSNIYQ